MPRKARGRRRGRFKPPVTSKGKVNNAQLPRGGHRRHVACTQGRTHTDSYGQFPRAPLSLRFNLCMSIHIYTAGETPRAPRARGKIGRKNSLNIGGWIFVPPYILDRYLHTSGSGHAHTHTHTHAPAQGLPGQCGSAIGIAQ